eukprot:gene11439-12789_t
MSWDEDLIDILQDEEGGKEDKSSWMENLVRAGRSTGPKEVLLRLAINRHLLSLQLAALQIQTSYRRYAAQMRVARIRRRFHTFCEVTQRLSEVVVEEVVLGTAWEISAAFLSLRDEVVMVRDGYGQAVQWLVESLLEQEVEEEVEEVAREVIAQAVDRFLCALHPHLHHRHQPVSAAAAAEAKREQNPVLQILRALAAEAADGLVRAVVVEAIQEEVRDYLLGRHCDWVLAHLLQEVRLQLTMELLRQNLPTATTTTTTTTVMGQEESRLSPRASTTSQRDSLFLLRLLDDLQKRYEALTRRGIPQQQEEEEEEEEEGSGNPDDQQPPSADDTISNAIVDAVGDAVGDEERLQVQEVLAELLSAITASDNDSTA